MSKTKDAKTVIIKDARLAFVALDKPRVNKLDLSAPPKFEATLLIKKTANLDGIKRAMKAAIFEKWGENAPKIKDLPIKDGDERDEVQGYKGHWYLKVTANQDRRPVVIDQMGEPADPKEAYSGCYADVAVNAFAWEYQKVKKGVSFGIQAVRLSAKEGKPFGAGPVDAAKLFSDSDEDSEFEDSEELEANDFEDEIEEKEEDEEVPVVVTKAKKKTAVTTRGFLD